MKTTTTLEFDVEFIMVPSEKFDEGVEGDQSYKEERVNDTIYTSGVVYVL